jgi:hypothetical protein
MSELHLMEIPRRCPPECVFMDAGHEQELNEPYVLGDAWVKTVVVLEGEEEYLPLVSKPAGDIVPEALDPCVVDAPANSKRDE